MIVLLTCKAKILTVAPKWLRLSRRWVGGGLGSPLTSGYGRRAEFLGTQPTPHPPPLDWFLAGANSLAPQGSRQHTKSCLFPVPGQVRPAHNQTLPLEHGPHLPANTRSGP